MQSKSLKVAAVAVALFLVSTPAFAEGAASASTAGWGVFGAVLGMGIAAGICGLGQGRAAAAALEGIARNPQAAGKIQTPMLIALVFIETLVLFTFGFGFLALGALA
jgi:F-type H+-transporting ATPase subunit c